MRELDGDFARAGISVRFVTIGSQAKADDFCSRHNAAAVCIGDADKHTYKAMGLNDFDLTKLMTTPALLERPVSAASRRISQTAKAAGRAIANNSGIVLSPILNMAIA